MVKNPPAMRETWVQSLGWKVFWPGEIHVPYGPWGRKESDTTEWLSLTLTELKTWLFYNLNNLTTFEIISDIKDNSFSRSRSSSVTSIDKESREAISALHFCETFTRKTDSAPSPCLWVGTTLGTVLVIALNLPPGGEQRLLQPVIVSPSGMYALLLDYPWKFALL